MNASAEGVPRFHQTIAQKHHHLQNPFPQLLLLQTGTHLDRISRRIRPIRHFLQAKERNDQHAQASRQQPIHQTRHQQRPRHTRTFNSLFPSKKSVQNVYISYTISV